MLNVASCFVLSVVPVERLHGVNTTERYPMLGRLEVDKVRFGPPYLIINLQICSLYFVNVHSDVEWIVDV
jgi:hypothetical protein